ncbi:serine/threonine-protein kinase [Mycolicibacterium sp. F2034L]|uniref:serine/threonine-protein kinase n=1 Tax=Mycolicibacterium sp. F2034L TaxID=2926422 RepID=UPI001FF1B474|nr:serine/threonine-protein kinase [Mycolicibacterium sp. F2034L]MCK0175901.1 protein kinase [Mycolicibacterium sp. F2034L]
MPLSDGQKFAGYRVLRQLGSGGMGEVYLAKHPRLPRLDALKVLRVDLSQNREYRARFEREADLASTLWHPNIVGVHDRGEFEHHLWISMDYIDGSDVGKLLREKYPAGLPVNYVCAIATAVASALDYAHKQGLLHRDVKPANIMVGGDGDDRRIMLADFGVARAIGDVGGLTETNMTVGTVAYCAPEQLMGEELDGRADLYALAASCYEMLTGATVFPHSNAAVVISRHLNAAPPRIADTRPDLASLDHVLHTALAKSPTDRYPNATEFAARLRGTSPESTNAPSAEATQVRPANAPTNLSRPSTGSVSKAPRPQSSPRSKALLALGVVAAVAAVVLLWRPWQTNTGDSPLATTTPPSATAAPASTTPPSSPNATPTTTALPPAPPQPTPTEIVTAAAVNSAGLPAAGYSEKPASPSRATLSECSQPSVSALQPGIYSCYPFAASATTCWPAQPQAMLCLDDPWNKQLTRFAFSTATLPPVQPPSIPQPLAVLLADGSRCSILIGGARGRADGYSPAYGCNGGDGPPIVVTTPGSGEGIDQTAPTWTAWVADVNETPRAEPIVTAIFAG